jgi:hypothetical protein
MCNFMCSTIGMNHSVRNAGSYQNFQNGALSNQLTELKEGGGGSKSVVSYRILNPIGLICYPSAEFLPTQRIRTHVLQIKSYALWPNG